MSRTSVPKTYESSISRSLLTREAPQHSCIPCPEWSSESPFVRLKFSRLQQQCPPPRVSIVIPKIFVSSDPLLYVCSIQVGAVVVGLDTSFGFRQMCMASAYIQKGAHFLGTNPDVADRVGSLLMPGTGPILSSIRTASGVRTPPVSGFTLRYGRTGYSRDLRQNYFA